MSGRLDGKRALVVGASRGSGRTIARTMAAEGGHLAVAARGQENLDSLSREITNKGGKAVPS